jgi:hypothetical protein
MRFEAGPGGFFRETESWTVWAPCKLRRPASCAARCHRELKPGDRAYHPIRDGNGVTRNMRACPACVRG